MKHFFSKERNVTYLARRNYWTRGGRNRQRPTTIPDAAGW